MYEFMTSDYILERMLNTVSDELDKREGSVIYDALMPCALELSNAYRAIDVYLTESFADTASRYYLVKRAAERGILPDPATYPHVKGRFQGADVPAGTRFSCGGYNYQVTDFIEKINNDYYYTLVCETVGTEANKNTGQLLPINDYINGLEYAEIVNITVPGEDEEDGEKFRIRYYSSFTNQAFGGNVDDYKVKVNKIDGVGGVKVIPIWNGGGTVKLIIINSNFEVPSSELVNEVQRQIDPTNAADGQGIAPIGHVVTVVPVETKKIDIVTNITFKVGYSWGNLRTKIEDAVSNYLKELSASWSNFDNIIVRISQIETRILSIPGIEDIFETQLNGAKENVVLSINQIPIKGEING